MNGTQARSRQPGRLLIGVLVAVVVFAAMKLLDPFGRNPTPERVERAAMADPDYRVYLQAFKESFPAEYAAFLQQTTEDAKAGLPADQAKARGFQRVNQLVEQHRRDLTRAPDAALLTHLKAEAAVLDALDDTECARLFVTGAANPAVELTPERKRSFAQFTAATMRAERAGIDAPVQRSATPSTTDVQALAAGIQRRGVTPAQVQAFSTGGLAALSTAEQCTVGRHVLAAVATMPPASAARVWSQMLGG